MSIQTGPTLYEGWGSNWRCRLAWRLDGNGVYMQKYSTLLVPFLALTAKPLEIALDGLVQQVSRAKFRRTTRYLHVSSIYRISMEFCLFPCSHCGRKKPNEANRSTTRSNFYSTSTTLCCAKWIQMDSHEKFPKKIPKNLEKRTAIHGDSRWNSSISSGRTFETWPLGAAKVFLEIFCSKRLSFWRCQGGTDNQQDEFVPSCWGVIP